MRSVRTLLAILRGEALILVKRDERNADVVVGKFIDRRFAISSMVGAVKAMM